MHPTPLPGRAGDLLGDGGFETGVCIGDDQVNPGQAASLKRGQELAPGLERLALTDSGAQHDQVTGSVTRPDWPVWS